MTDALVARALRAAAAALAKRHPQESIRLLQVGEACSFDGLSVKRRAVDRYVLTRLESNEVITTGPLVDVLRAVRAERAA